MELVHIKLNQFIIIIIIIYSLKIGAGQQGRISGTYNCPRYKIKCRNIKYKELHKTRSQSQHNNSANTSSIVYENVHTITSLPIKRISSAITVTRISRSFYLQDGGENQLAYIRNEITSLSPYV